MRRALLRTILAASLAATAACTASPSGSAAIEPTVIVVNLAPLTSQVAPGGSIAFTASVSGSVDLGILWSVQEGAVGGSVTASGTYKAPAAEGTFHVVAASHADASKFQVARVTVSAAATAVSVAVTPASTAVDACQTVPFSATVSGAANQGVTWSVREGSLGGTISLAGVYTAPASAGTYHVVATSLADPTRTAEVPVAVGPEKVLSIALTPASTSVVANDSVPFSATVTTSCGTFAAQ